MLARLAHGGLDPLHLPDQEPVHGELELLNDVPRRGTPGLGRSAGTSATATASCDAASTCWLASRVATWSPAWI